MAMSKYVCMRYDEACSWKKTGDMAVGAVCFHNDRQVKRFYVKERKNEIVNRLNKTKEDRLVDYEAERQERERAIGRKKKEFALKQVWRSSFTQLTHANSKKRPLRPNGHTKNKPQLGTTQAVSPVHTHAPFRSSNDSIF